MVAEAVLDASVLAAALFNETGTDAAHRFLADGPRLIAPDLLLIELTSVAAKKVWRKEATVEVARRALAAVSEFTDELVPCAELAERALTLASEHALSAYDAFYVALAHGRGLDLVTLDGRLIRALEQAGLSGTARAP